MPDDEALGGDVSSAAQADLDILNDESAPEAETEETSETEETEETEETSEETPAPAEEEEEAPEEVPDPDAPEETTEDKAKKPPVEGEVQDKGIAKEIKAKYPDFFKNFPAVRGAIFRDLQFRELIPTPEDARELVETAQVYQEYEQKIMTGDPTILLKGLAESENGEELLEKFVMNFMPTVEKFSPELRGKMIFPYVRRIFNNALSDAKASGNKNLENSIGHIARYLWNSTTIPEERAPQRPEDNPEAVKLREENQKLHQRQADSFIGRVTTTGVGELRKSVEQTFRNDKRFSPIEVRTLVDDIVKQTRTALDRDPRHNRAMSAHWNRARSLGLADTMVPRIVNAFLGGAKNVMPTIRAKVVQSALKQKGITQPAVGQIPGTPRGGSPSRGGKVVGSGKIDYSKTSDADILSDDPSKIKLKGK
jgi:hypothetical protein